MRKLLLLLSLLYSAMLFAQDFKILHGPYLQGVTENEVTVVWVTNKEAVSWVELAPDDESHFYAEERQRFYQTNFGKKEIGTLHKIKISGLEKATRYRYRIYSKEVTAKEHYYIGYGKTVATNVYRQKPLTFRTLDTSQANMKFAVVNDIHENSELLEKLISQTNISEQDFVLFNGDMASNMFSEEQVLGGFVDQAVRSFARETPFFMARGNHETRGLFSTEYINYFPTSTGQPYYAFRQGPAFFIVLDGGEDKPDSDIEYHSLADFDNYRESQIKWLTDVLQSEDFKQAPVKVVVMHVPPIRSTWHGPIQIKKHFIPLLNKAGIHLMLSAHLHKHFYIEAGNDDCNFPVLINSNNHVAMFSIAKQEISIKVLSEDGKSILTKTIPVY
ncbi:metallophosphoesterase family protein [Bacteroides sp. 519]|uniref:purple acid phosphatase family protein n=1 Tax=Bacteroides sp. 519 TaxID=2302937 RepID=UPI0013D73F0A|nr:metallophosphoesterase family protein [Bacteroides sp. 519]NDV58873.1 metallophosphoesterase family protein [Bacteroides sp. 519]